MSVLPYFRLSQLLHIFRIFRQFPLSGQSVLFLQLHGGDPSGVDRAPESTRLLWADIHLFFS